VVIEIPAELDGSEHGLLLDGAEALHSRRRAAHACEQRIHVEEAGGA
jgi:hypothetical protein